MKRAPKKYGNPQDASLVKRLRDKRNWSQARVGQELHITPGHVSRIERGVRALGELRREIVRNLMRRVDSH